ncbi:hypothetical protein CURTO8I2_220203 [Curtobacterium sp. 8I-2]|nr:hypothetical protein CURTO8I2_220203 [Curtobacterium sp. 8I-2]
MSRSNARHLNEGVPHGQHRRRADLGRLDGAVALAGLPGVAGPLPGARRPAAARRRGRPGRGGARPGGDAARVRTCRRRLPGGPRRPGRRRRVDLFAELLAPRDGRRRGRGGQAVLDREADGAVRQRLPRHPPGGATGGRHHERRVQLPARPGDRACP